jgi:hypothetical protein
MKHEERNHLKIQHINGAIYMILERFVKCFLVGIFLLTLTPITVIPFSKFIGGLNIEYSEGTRSGIVQKISKKGLIYETWEGELNLGYNTTNTESNQIIPAIFEFSVSSDGVAELIQAAEASGERVTLQYKQYIMHGYHRGSTPYDVIGIKPKTNTVEK